MQVLVPYDGSKTPEGTTLPAPVRDIAFSVNFSTGDNLIPTVDIIFLFSPDDFLSFSKPDTISITMLKDNIPVTITTQHNLNFDLSALDKNIPISITCKNNIGESETSNFILPMNKSIVLEPDSALDVLFKHNLDILERNTILNKSNSVFFYRNVHQDDIDLDWDSFDTIEYDGIPSEKDKLQNGALKCQVNLDDAIVMDLAWNSFKPSDDFGFENDFYYMRKDASGWVYMSQPEIDFVESMQDFSRKEYEKFRLKNGLTLVDPYILKFIWKHPTSTKQSLVIYFMEGSRWQL